MKFIYCASMTRPITDKEISYLLDHLLTCYEGPDLKLHLRSFQHPNGADHSEAPKILIPLSGESLQLDTVQWIDHIPVLFPCSENDKWYTLEGNQILFHHDILKSAFFLLSGYQEYNNPDKDEFGRFRWESSIQHKLEITGKPVVNYYFEVLLDAIELYCLSNELPFRRRPPGPPVLFLSHDVDRIRKYSLRNVAYMTLLFLGFIRSAMDRQKRWKLLLDHASGTFFFKKDPYRNFKQLLMLEKTLKIHSSWFMLEKKGRKNSRYRFRKPEIRNLIRLLEQEGHEVGIHGTMESSENQAAMKSGLDRLNKVTGNPVFGNRQHFLKFNHPLTTRILNDSDLEYDASLGFSEQIGFRNSYASPFRLYDFELQEASKIWYLPLNIMDISLINHMNVPLPQIREAIEPVLIQVKKFGGVLGLLWHNCNLDEEEHPEINRIYEDLLKWILQEGFASQSGLEVLRSLRTSGVSGKSWSAGSRK